MRDNCSILIFILLLGTIGLLSACGRIQAGQPDVTDINLEMSLEPDQPTVGPATLIFTLTDVEGQPINEANLEIEGNMTHAGMVPVLAQTAAGEAGRYAVPFEWTMGGDWIVTVQVTLPDGRQFSREMPVTVQ